MKDDELLKAISKQPQEVRDIWAALHYEAKTQYNELDPFAKLKLEGTTAFEQTAQGFGVGFLGLVRIIIGQWRRSG
jgi:hypothetical protein